MWPLRPISSKDTIMSREQLENGSTTTLNGAINASVTSVTVTDGSLMSANGQFRVIVGSEIMLVTSRSGNVLTVVRGVEDTTAASHSDTDTISQILTRDGVRRLIGDHTAGANNINKKFHQIVDGNGDALDSTDFTWVNQGSSTVTDNAGGSIFLSAPTATGENVRLLKRSAPSTPYTLYASFSPNMNDTAGLPSCGIGFREDSSGELIGMAISNSNELAVYKWNSPTSFNSNLKTRQFWTPANPWWLGIEDDGTDLKFHVSTDGGINFHEFASEGRTVFMAGGPDEIMFFVNNGNIGENVNMTLFGWIEE